MQTKISLSSFIITCLILVVSVTVVWFTTGGHKAHDVWLEQVRNSSPEAIPAQRPAPDPNQLEPAQINVEERLGVLFRQYPSLTTPPANDASRHYQVLAAWFDINDRPALSSQFAQMELMLGDDSRWDANAAQAFLAEHQLLSVKVRQLGPLLDLPKSLTADDYASGNTSRYQDQLNTAKSYIIFCRLHFALHAKLGQLEEAAAFYQLVHEARKVAKVGIEGSSIGVAISNKLDSLTQQVAPEQPSILTIRERFPFQLPSYSEILRYEFRINMETLYSWAQTTPDGRLVINSPEFPREITVIEIESAFTTAYTYYVRELAEYEEIHGYSPDFLTLAKIQNNFQAPLSSLQQEIIDRHFTTFAGHATGLNRAKLVHYMLNAALDIATAENAGRKYTEPLPINFQTRERVSWNGDSNSLQTKLGMEEISIEIPSRNK
ncbi:hypothetical protein [Persicirhabdus sediminis]|uniref:Uncharacterized protein n=1 Tax=Persicirhabdus sediminis TaxID=454144 RepID=A0A8J7MD26_9BACT|nr:hypothetical protein [Persicirhabdus sediminis]MBK1790303.1 hypothetical protein [Persicirhabdus sediminis]